MSNQATLYLKHRPKDLKQIVGNAAAIKAIKTLMAREDGPPHSFLFTGPAGCGKTTLARIVASKLGASGLDLVEMDLTELRGIDNIRDLRSTLGYQPVGGDCRVFILDEVHQLTKDAQSALLKILEDTPSHVYFMLATTDPQKLLKTIRTRCTPIVVNLLNDEELHQLIDEILHKEGIQDFPKNAIESIIAQAMGSARMALVLLDQIIDLPDKDMEAAIREIAAKESQINELCQAIWKNQKWSVVAAIISTITDEPETVRRAALGYFSSMMLKMDNPRLYSLLRSFERPYYDTGKAGLLMSCFEALNRK